MSAILDNNIASHNTLSMSSVLKVLLIWIPMVLWYAIGFVFTHSYAFFHHVDSIYYQVAVHWFHGKTVYTGDGFVYFPSAAALLSPFSFFSLKTFEILFRLISIIIFSIGIYSFSGFIAQPNSNRTFLIMILSSVLLIQAPLFEGQMHIMTTGFMLMGFVALLREKWWCGALWLTMALALKPTSIVLYLMAFSLYPKVSLKLIVISIAMTIITFVLQSPHYVAMQYVAFAQQFEAAMHFDGLHPGHWATFFGALAFYTNKMIVGTTQFEIRILLALFVFCCGFFAKKFVTKKEAIYFIVALSMCYLMLFNSRTENNDYIMVIPMIGFSLSMTINNKKYWQATAHVVGIVLMMLNWNISKLITPHNNLWLNPTIIIIYTIYLLQQFFFKIKNNLQSA